MKRTKRIMAYLVALALLLTAIPMEPALAATGQNPGVEGGGADLAAPDADQEQLLLNYVVIEKEHITAPEVQTAVVSIGDGTNVLSDVVLSVQNQATGEVREVAAKQVAGDGIVFEIRHDNEKETAVWRLDFVRYVVAGKGQTIQLAGAGIEAVYGVNQQLVTDADAYVSDETAPELTADVVKFDGNGNQTSETSIASAIAENSDVIKNSSRQTPIVGAMANSPGNVNIPGNQLLGAPTSGNLIIVFDPGHDGTHAGASYNGYQEAERALKITQYAREELSQYRGVTIYMTRDTAACPNGGGSNSDCLTRRVQIAKNFGANVFVSFHLNASGNHSARGAGVYYPNSNYRPDIHSEAYGLGSSILNKLLELGLGSWGMQIRNSEDKTYYPDGSLADYLGVIRQNKEAGITPVLIEHAFMDNAGDVQFINSDEKLKKLGVADATGIAQYYHLSKGEYQYRDGDAKVGITPIENYTKMMLEANGVPLAYNLFFAVYTSSSDVKWYWGFKDNDRWLSSMNVSDYNKTGTYYVDAYAVRQDGSYYVVGRNTFALEELNTSWTGPQGETWKIDSDGLSRCYDANGNQIKNAFQCDGTYTYFFQADGSPMTNRLTYHPDGKNLIYFDEQGHEVFDHFQYCKDVKYTCYFNTYGYLCIDEIVFSGGKPYYLDKTGAMKQNEWFYFGNGVDIGSANADGSLKAGGWGKDPWGRQVFYHWNGMVARGLITDGVWYYHMDEKDGHLRGQFR
ncbi:hypothetical protein FACS1894111_07800 [Clostridia bacterium]|nr:hypothetical protein FACS1894111_07800 [Clostridia bacterium]